MIDSSRSELTGPDAVARYPEHREADVVLRDGSVVHIRPVRASDEPALLEFLRGLPSEDRRLRFFGLGNNLARTAHDEADVDYARRFGLVVTVTPEEHLVGHAMYVATEATRAEVAFTIAPEYQSQGLATLLLGQLAEVAAAQGITTFEATMLPENRRMLDVFRGSGFPVETHYDWGNVAAEFPTSLSPEALARFDQREARGAASALGRILAPASIAVIGASRKSSSVGGAVVRNLLAAGFPGPVYPINPSGGTIYGCPAYATVEATPGPVDLAIVAIPAANVLDVADACGRKGVHGLVVLSAGFAEVGADGRHRQAELLRICRAYGMRLVGPNCIGVISTDPRCPLNATFGNLMPRAGRIGMATQSGALGLAAMDFTAARALGFSSLVSMGNKADISGNDVLGYLASDPRTDVILLYLESFGNPRKFARLARRIGRSKPIVALKSGRSSVGARATASHTGALLAASDVTVDTLFRQSGVIRTDTLDEMLDVADLLVHQPLPRGPRVAIVTNVGGPAIMCADTCEARGLEVPVLAEETQLTLGAHLPSEASLRNPVDLLAAATPEQYALAVDAVATDPNVDAVIAIFMAPLATRPEEVARALVHAVEMRTTAKPVLAVFMSPEPLPDLTTPGGAHVPGYHTPEPAAIALAHATRYAVWHAQPQDEPCEFADIHTDDVGVLLAAALQQHGDGWLSPDEVHRVLQAYGLPLLPECLGTTPEEAVRCADELGGEVALKAIAPGLVHKSDSGAVTLHLSGADAVRAAALHITDNVQRAIGAPPAGFLVQRMAPPGVEMLIGVVNDPLFGPIVACGAGGTLVELLKDVSIRLSPLTPADAHAMLRELRSFPLLQGYRGAPPTDIEAIEDAVLRIAALVGDHPSILELDLNPFIVNAGGAVVVDARIRVGQPAARKPIGARL